MKTDETVEFDYMKPDFSILKGRRICMVAMQPEYIFYFKHRIIHWLNEINEHYNDSINFENVRINRYMVGDKNHVSSTFGVKDSAGTLHFEYDKNQQIEGYRLIGQRDIFDNKKIFKETHNMFDFNITIDTKFNKIKHSISRFLDINNDDIDVIIIKYKFDELGDIEKKINIDFSRSFDPLNIISHGEIDKFDQFFNKISWKAFLYNQTFLEMYPYFSISDIKTAENCEIFYMELKDLYLKGLFDNGLNENMTVLEMVGI